MIERAPRRHRYTVIDSAALSDSQLDWDARGLLAFLLSKPDNWRVDREHLVSQAPSGARVVRRLLAELEAAGYLTRERHRHPDGRLSWKHVVHERPVPDGQRTTGSFTTGAERTSGPTSENDASPQVGTSGSLCTGGKRASGTNKSKTEGTSTEVSTEEQHPPSPQPLPGVVAPDPVAPAARPAAEVEQVFVTWQEATGKHRAVLDAKRRRLIGTALKSHGLEVVLKAVAGWRNSPFHCGENDRGRVFNDLGLLLRDAPHIEQFAGYADGEGLRAPAGKRAANGLAAANPADLARRAVAGGLSEQRYREIFGAGTPALPPPRKETG